MNAPHISWLLTGAAVLGFVGWVWHTKAEEAAEAAARSVQQARAERLVSEAGMPEYLTGLCAAALEADPTGDWQVTSAMQRRDLPFTVIAGDAGTDAFVWRSLRRPMEDWEAAAVGVEGGEVEDHEGCPFLIDDAGNATIPSLFLALRGPL